MRSTIGSHHLRVAKNQVVVFPAIEKPYTAAGFKHEIKSLSVLLEVNDLHCGYASHAVIHGVSFHVNKGSLVCLLGPSGCGKTTILRAIAGFEPVKSGSVSLNAETLSDPTRLVPPEKRRIGVVFQESTLFPHLTVTGNVEFGLINEESARKTRLAGEMLSLVGLSGLEDRYPHELSGGQQQRVALARALAPRPRLVLLDEPFSSLDVELRQRLGEEVLEVLKGLAITAVLVTHDQSEAFRSGRRHRGDPGRKNTSVGHRL